MMEQGYILFEEDVYVLSKSIFTKNVDPIYNIIAIFLIKRTNFASTIKQNNFSNYNQHPTLTSSYKKPKHVHHPHFQDMLHKLSN